MWLNYSKDTMQWSRDPNETQTPNIELVTELENERKTM